MPTLYRQLKQLPWAAIPAVSSVSTDHGRRARRTIKAALAPAWIGFAGAAQVAQVRRTVTKKGKKTVEVACLITSDRDASPATLAAWIRGHREIENRLHWVQRCAAWPSASCGWTGIPISPPPTATTPAIRSGPWPGASRLRCR